MIIIPRIARNKLETPFLHLMVQGINKEFIFKTEECIKFYLNLINEEIKNYKFSILSYCVMNNHAHFLIYVENIEELSNFMHSVNTRYVKYYNQKENRCGVLFRNRYHTEPIYDRRYFINCINYIHMNPVKAGIVDKMENYKYSSYKEYQGNYGVAKNKILENIFGKCSNMLEIIEKNNYRIFKDIDDIDIRIYFESGLNYFIKSNLINLCDIVSDRNILKKLIVFLYRDCGLKYIEISECLDISMNVIKRIKSE